MLWWCLLLDKNGSQAPFLVLIKTTECILSCLKKDIRFQGLVKGFILKITLFWCNHKFQTPMGKRIPHEIPKAQGYCDLQLSRSQSKRLAPKKKLGSIGGDKEFHTCCAIG